LNQSNIFTAYKLKLISVLQQATILLRNFMIPFPIKISILFQYLYAFWPNYILFHILEDRFHNSMLSTPRGNKGFQGTTITPDS